MTDAANGIKIMLIKFEGLSRPIQLEQDGKLLPYIAGVFSRWPFREVQQKGHPEPAIFVREDQAGFRVHAVDTDESGLYRDGVDLACGLVVHLNRAWLREHPHLLCLHGAAADFGGRLVVFPNTYRSGKSVLSGCLAAAGVRIFGDDILPIEPDSNRGMGLGLAPRLRLPLPDGLGVATRRFVQRRRGVDNKRYLYLRLDERLLAKYGEQAEIGSFVLLDRSPGAEASIKRVGEGVLLKRLVLQNFAHDVPVDETLGRLHALVADAGCYRLSYSDPDEAVALLKSRFVVWPERKASALSDIKPGKIRKKVRRSRPRMPSGPRFRRYEDVSEKRVEQDLFLVDTGGNAIYHLNGIGAGLWRLLDGTYGLDDAVEVLQDAFPNMERAAIENDVHSLVTDLSARGLLLDG